MFKTIKTIKRNSQSLGPYRLESPYVSSSAAVSCSSRRGQSHPPSLPYLRKKYVFLSRFVSSSSQLFRQRFPWGHPEWPKARNLPDRDSGFRSSGLPQPTGFVASHLCGWSATPDGCMRVHGTSENNKNLSICWLLVLSESKVNVFKNLLKLLYCI